MALGTLLVMCFGRPTQGHATTIKDVLIGLRVVDFLADPPPPHSPFAILYDSRSRESETDAHAIFEWMLSGAAGAKTPLAPVMVDIHSLNGAQGARVAFIAMGTDVDPIADFTCRNGVLTLSSELSCVREGKCVVGISSAPRVEVLLNRSLSVSCGVTFSEAFRMMVTEY